MMTEVTTLIRFKDAWLTGWKPEDGIIAVGKAAHVYVTHSRKNENGDGYFVDGHIHIEAELKEREEVEDGKVPF